MRLAVKTNLDEVFADLDRFVDRVETVAAARTLNKLSEQAQTAGFRKINDLYQIGPRTMDKYAAVKAADASNLQAEITVKGNGFPLYEFKPIATKQGVSVLVKGRRVLIPHAFIAKMRSNHTGVFARGAYGSKSGRKLKITGTFGHFNFGRGERVKRANRWGSTELPINEFFTFAPPDAFSNADVVAAMQDRVEEQAPKVLAQEIRFATSGR